MIRPNSKSIVKVLASTALLTLTAVGIAGCADPADEYGPRGLSWVYGDPPKGGPDPKRNLTFKPAYYAVVYLKFEDGARLVAKHAFFEPIKDDNGESDIKDEKFLTCAVNYLKDLPSDENCVPFDFDIKDDIPPIVYENFEHFRFGSQQRVYVFIDNNDVAFNEYPMSFAPFGPDEEPVPDTTGMGNGTKEKNLSFYHANPRAFPSSERKGLLYFANYFRGKKGDEILSKDDNAIFSINFNLLVCRKPDDHGTCDFTKQAQVIPLAIDPDTGNGWGNVPTPAD